jgi:hypothetical protein
MLRNIIWGKKKPEERKEQVVVVPEFPKTLEELKPQHTKKGQTS